MEQPLFPQDISQAMCDMGPSDMLTVVFIYVPEAA